MRSDFWDLQLVPGSSRFLQGTVSAAALARYTAPMEDSEGTIEMNRYPKITINLDHLPQGYHRSHVVNIPIMVEIRPKPIDQSRERRELTRLLKGDGDGEPKQKAARVSSAEQAPPPEAKPLSVYIPASPPPDSAAAPVSLAPAAKPPPPPKATVWTTPTPTVVETHPDAAPPTEAAPHDLSVPILLTISAKAKPNAKPPNPEANKGLDPPGADTVDYNKNKKSGDRADSGQSSSSKGISSFAEMFEKFGVEAPPALADSRLPDDSPPAPADSLQYDELQDSAPQFASQVS